MPLQQIVTIDLHLMGDGISKIFTFDLGRMFAVNSDTTILDAKIPPKDAFVSNNFSGFGNPIVTLDGSRITITYDVAPLTDTDTHIGIGLLF